MYSTMGCDINDLINQSQANQWSQMVNLLCKKHVIANQTALVEEKLRSPGFASLNIRNSHYYPELSASGLELRYRHGSNETNELLHIKLKALKSAIDEDTDDIMSMKELIKGELKEREHQASLKYPFQIHEWYLVTSYLSNALIKLKQPVLVNKCGMWWGRGDGSIQKDISLINIATDGKIVDGLI
tara:strand:+ start:403 stop:960 length:558 start_codon:yes stop_codon:yes gene_type:complete